MPNLGSVSLAIAAGLSAAAALAHIACVVIGPSAYRFMGAGERMARAVEAGKLKPTIVTLVISAVLMLWAAYALSAAGYISRLPFTKFAVLTITLVYLGRAFGFPLLRSAFPENSTTFWLVSSGICLVIGALHAYGLAARWFAL
jgi:hypothetical protein